MKLFIDSADVQEIAELAQTGLVEGVTTNPTLMARSGRKMRDVLTEICRIVPGPVSAEVIATDVPSMLAEGESLAAIARNITVKLPLTVAGLETCRALRGRGIDVNVTLCFSPAQALLAAKAKATFISPFIGRLDDTGGDGMQMIRDINQIFCNMVGCKTEILAASIRSVAHVIDSAKSGAHAVTLPPAIFRAMFQHELTDRGLAAFLADAHQAGLTIMPGGADSC